MRHKAIIWEASNGQYINGKVAKIGLNIVVGAISYNGIDRDPTKKYIGYIHLPGLKTKDAKFPTEEEAKKFVENQFKIWFRAIIDDEPVVSSTNVRKAIDETDQFKKTATLLLEEELIFISHWLETCKLSDLIISQMKERIDFINLILKSAKS